MPIIIFNDGTNSGGGGGGTVTGADNGLSLSGTIVELGGPLIKDTTVDTAGFTLFLGSGNNNFIITDGGNSILGSVSDGATFQSEFGISSDVATLVATDFDDNQGQLLAANGRSVMSVMDGASGQEMQLSIDHGVGALYLDNVFGLWMVYDSDYSTASEGNPRSIPDVGWVESEIAGTGPVATHKVAGLSASGTLISYPLTQSTPTLFRIGNNATHRSGIAPAATVSVTWTDTSGASNTAALTPYTGPNPMDLPGAPVDIYVLNGTTIVISITITAGSTWDIAKIIQQLI